jgi:hypothetical protein
MSKDEAIKARLKEVAERLRKLVETWDHTKPIDRIVELWALETHLYEVAAIEEWKMRKKR